MTEQELTRIIKAVQKNNTLHDSVSKILTGVCTVAVIWVGTMLVELDKKFAVMEANQNNLSIQMQVITEFTKEPRFTKENFLSEMKPYEQRVGAIELFVADVKERVRNLERGSR